MTLTTTIEELDFEKISKMLALVGKAKLNCSIEELIRRYDEGRLDPCEHAEVISLIEMLTSDEKSSLQSKGK